MSWIRLAWKNLWARPLSALLSLILFSLGIGLITVLLLVNNQLTKNFDRNLADIDLVIGAKGSPMQMILCNMYHVDAPTGNVTIKEVSPFLNPKHPLIEMAVPTSIGDSYKTYRIIGTTHEYARLYDGELAQGRWWTEDLEVVVGAAVAKKLHIHVGDQFMSSHGFDDNSDLVHDHHTPFTVVGIMKGTGSVLDQVILTNTSSVWSVHDHDHDDDHEAEAHASDSMAHEDHDHSGHDHSGHDHHDHDHGAHVHTTVEVDASDFGTVNNAQLLDHPEEEITALLIRYKNNNFQTMSMPRSINENTDMQAASPPYEISRVYSMMGSGTEALRAIAILIAIVSGLSIFFSLLSSLKDRKYELSLMRVMGAGRSRLFLLIVLEGLLVAALGFVIGLLLAHIGTWAFASRISEQFRYSLSAWEFLPAEAWMGLIALLIGLVASVIPAWQAYKTDIHSTLSEG